MVTIHEIYGMVDCSVSVTDVNHIACFIIAIGSSAINPKSHSYSIVTFSNRTLKEPLKMHYFGNRLSATSYNIKSSE